MNKTGKLTTAAVRTLITATLRRPLQIAPLGDRALIPLISAAITLSTTPFDGQTPAFVVK